MAEIRRADPTARRQAVALVVLGAVVGTALLFAFELYRDPLLGWLRAQPSRVSVAFLLVAVTLSVPPSALAVYIFGRLVLGSNGLNCFRPLDCA
jgi:hypothetical protein